MDTGRIVTYSFLAHINNTGIWVHDFADIFVPLIKRVLSNMNTEGLNKGKHISEIKTRIDSTYFLDVPYPLLEKVLNRVAKEFNKDEEVRFQLYQDKSFMIKNFVFADYEEVMRQEEKTVSDVEELYYQFLELRNIQKSSQPSIFDYIDKNRASLSKYFANPNTPQRELDFSVQAEFIDTFKDRVNVYGALRKIYLGSIISAYLEYKTEGRKAEGDSEFLLDTNFLIGLLDLTAVDSTHTCKKIIDICKELGYRVSVLDYTIEETKALLDRTAEDFDGVFVAKKINPYSIYNACDRRNLSKTDLQRIAANLEQTISEEFGLYYVKDTIKLRKEAKFSAEYDMFRGMRVNEWSALHDATAFKYVQHKRGKRVRDFFEAKCWFVTNPLHEITYITRDGFVPEVITAEDLVNILWLTNPNVKDKFNVADLSEIGLTRLVSSTINAALPSARIIRDLDANIQKYAKDVISDKDIIRVAKRIAKKTNESLEGLNRVASTDPTNFVKRLEEEALKEAEEQALFQEKLKRTIFKIKETVEENAAHREKEMRDSFVIREERLRTDLAITLTEQLAKKDGELRITMLLSLKDTFIPLKKTRQACERKANKMASLQLGVIVLSPLIVAAAGETLLGWNLTGSFIPTAILYLLFYFYFVIKKKEWSLGNMWNDLKSAKVNKYYDTLGFDIEQYERVRSAIDELEKGQNVSETSMNLLNANRQ